MTNYWSIAPWPNDNSQLFDQVWKFDSECGVIAIRWHQIGNPSGLSEAQIEGKLFELSGLDGRTSARQIWTFYNRIDVGDVIVARRGVRLAIGIGRVKRTAYFDYSKGMTRLNGLASPYVGASFIDVKWERLDATHVPEQFTRQTVANIGEAKYFRLFGRVAA